MAGWVTIAYILFVGALVSDSEPFARVCYLRLASPGDWVG